MKRSLQKQKHRNNTLALRACLHHTGLCFQNETEGFVVSVMKQIKSEMAAGSLCHVQCTTNVIKYHEHPPDKSKLKHSQLQ